LVKVVMGIIDGRKAIDAEGIMRRPAGELANTAARRKPVIRSLPNGVPMFPGKDGFRGGQIFSFKIGEICYNYSMLAYVWGRLDSTRGQTAFEGER
jgi:hypothetical protein